MPDRAELAAHFAGTVLEGLPVEDAHAGAFVISGIDPSGLLAAWRTARALVPATGRWPVLITDEWGRGWEPDPEPPPTDELDELDEVARTFDPWAGCRSWMNDPLAEEAPYAARGFFGTDLSGVVHPPPDPFETRGAFERRLYEHILTDPELTARVRTATRSVVSTDYWYVPERVQMLLLPTAVPWLAAAWVDLFEVDAEDLAAALYQWYRRCGAELVAAWGTMLQFVVARPPSPGDDAWAVAGQILAQSSHLDISQWELAVAVADGETWVIHRRP